MNNTIPLRNLTLSEYLQDWYPIGEIQRVLTEDALWGVPRLAIGSVPFNDIPSHLTSALVRKANPHIKTQLSKPAAPVHIFSEDFMSFCRWSISNPKEIHSYSVPHNRGGAWYNKEAILSSLLLLAMLEMIQYSVDAQTTTSLPSGKVPPFHQLASNARVGHLLEDLTDDIPALFFHLFDKRSGDLYYFLTDPSRPMPFISDLFTGAKDDPLGKTDILLAHLRSDEVLSQSDRHAMLAAVTPFRCVLAFLDRVLPTL